MSSLLKMSSLLRPTPRPHHLHHRNFTTTAITLLPKLLSFTLNPRRFFKITHMSFANNSIISNNRSPPKNPNNFPTPESLSVWLKPLLPTDSYTSWGIKPGTKNIHNLWLELSEGEISLDTDSTPPVRTVESVVVRIVRDNKVLIESHQELSNGDVRERCLPLSEKMKPGDKSVEAAVYRAVKEELGSVINNGIVRIVPNSYTKKIINERLSMSYPGLPACYVLHTVEAIVEGLPEGDFWSEEVDEYEDSEEGKKLADGALSCKKHYWKWVDSNSI